MTQNPETQWLNIKNGDQKAFKSLFYDFVTPLSRYAFHFTHDTFLSEEIVQDALLKLWQNRLQINIHGSIKSYLFQMIHNACMNAIAHQKTQKNTQSILCSDQKWHMLEETLMIDYFMTEDPLQEIKFNILDKTISDLPTQCQQIFSLSRNDHMSAKEIASQLNISVTTVRTQIYRAMEKIKTAFAEL